MLRADSSSQVFTVEAPSSYSPVSYTHLDVYKRQVVISHKHFCM